MINPSELVDKPWCNYFIHVVFHTLRAANITTDLTLCMDEWMDDGWINGCCDFTAFSTVFQTKNEGRVTMKSRVQWHTVYIGKIRSPARS